MSETVFIIAGLIAGFTLVILSSIVSPDEPHEDFWIDDDEY